MSESNDVVVLFVDDEPSNIEPAKWSIERRFANKVRCEVRTFETAIQALIDEKPDVLVLDMVEGNVHPDPSEDCSGNKTYRHYWNTRFCPVVVYSAYPDSFSPDQEHPLVTRVKKGIGSPELICAEIERLLPQVLAIREQRNEIEKQIDIAAHVALRDVYPFALKHFSPTSVEARNIVLRCTRRRLAVLMDDVNWAGDIVLHWEQYIVPPIGNSPRLGDVLRKSNSSNKCPDDYRLVLSPSCDMAAGNGRKTKITKVLLAHCCSNEVGFQQIGKAKPKKTDSGLLGMLRRGYHEAHIFLPALPGRIPSMMADLRRLDLLPIEDIGIGKTFEVVASVDSPFRELVSWAYLQTSGRPGLPDRDFAKWAEEIANDFPENKVIDAK